MGDIEQARAEIWDTLVSAINRCRCSGIDCPCWANAYRDADEWLDTEPMQAIAHDAAAWRAILREYKAGYRYIYNINQDEMRSLEAIDPAIVTALRDNDG